MLNWALLRKIPVPSIILVSLTMVWATPAQAGNRIQIEAIADVIPACDILGQTVGRLVESIDGDGGDIPDEEFTRGRLISSPINGDGFRNGRGQLAYVGLSCNFGGNSTLATITSPYQISGSPKLPLLTATTRMHIARLRVPADRIITRTITELNEAFTQSNTVAAVVGDQDVKTSSASLILGIGSAYVDQNGVFGFAFDISTDLERIPAGQYGFATMLTVVPR
ncbi:hypothetical protein NWP21_18385 [Anabaenopsis sp. FSS-46]|uniref:hypothetical protein n=1 Tax=Anabaenopsis sp. FSS-46 TaxID=2971766 RepID=UPI002475FC07|nr:hypothetical protein [Anabaenopsis sp. FSS-46]MDH6100769.1 hypothetical protein [Anabaenopsis sp. FSS-46]